MPIRVCLAGATGWAGAPLAKAIAGVADLRLVAAVSRQNAGRRLGDVLGVPGLDTAISATAEEALATPCDVFVEYTKPGAAKANVSAALRHGAHVVIGTSGLSDEDLGELDALARAQGRGVLAAGNFSIAAVLLLKCAEMAAKHMPQWEIIDYASAGKVDAPSGTVRELAYRLANVRTPEVKVPLDKMQGPRETRGATMNGMQVHSVRLPGHVISAEVIFGSLDQKLSLRYDAGAGAEAYVEGALLAIWRVSTLTGLRRGLDSLMEF